MTKIDFLTKGHMDDFADDSLHEKIFKMYSEADSNESKKFSFSFLAYLLGRGISPDAIKKTGMNRAAWDKQINYIDASKGDITKLRDYDTTMRALGMAELIGDATKSLKYVNQTKALHKILDDNKATFVKGYKKGYALCTIWTYEVFATLFLYQVSILSIAALASQSEGGAKIDECIDKVPEWREFFKSSDNLASDKLTNKFILAGTDIELKAEAVQTYAEAMAENCELYSEVTMQDVALIIKLGLASFAYKLAGVLRFLIYLALVSKYKLEDRISTIKEIMSFAEKDLASKVGNEDAIISNAVTLKVDDIESMKEAAKESKDVKIKDDGEGGFTL